MAARRDRARRPATKMLTSTLYTHEAIAQRRQIQDLLRQSSKLLSDMK
jgi:hypothetical protein